LNLLKPAVLSLQSGFEFFDGLASFNSSGTGYSAIDAHGSGLFEPVRADRGFGFHWDTQGCVPFIILANWYKTTFYQPIAPFWLHFHKFSTAGRRVHISVYREHKMTRLKRIMLLSTGGTIASVPGTEGRAIAGALPGEELLARTGLNGRMEVKVESLFQKGSNAIGPSEWSQLAMRCEQLVTSEEVDGIVVTHGTDTLEDTAYYLQSVLDTSRVAIVVTGSQRTPHAPGSDAYVNLRHAIELAACDRARNLGVLVMFNQSVFSASFVRKTSSFQLHGFDAPGLGPLGTFDEGTFHLLQRPSLLPALANPPTLPRVDILPAYGGADAAMAQAILESGPAGVVIDGLGRGQVPPDWVPLLRKAVDAGIVVVVCSSTLHGATYQSYEYPGTLHDLENNGAIGVSHLSARKARIRLALLIAAGDTTVSSIRAAFGWRLPH